MTLFAGTSASQGLSDSSEREELGDSCENGYPHCRMSRECAEALRTARHEKCEADRPGRPFESAAGRELWGQWSVCARCAPDPG